MAQITNAYYDQLTVRLQASSVEDFATLLREHKTNMLAEKFREPAENVFAENIKWVAEQIISQPGSRNFKEPAAVTDTDMQKLEIMKAEYGFDYMKDLRIQYTANLADARRDYTVPFMLYIAGKQGDLSDYQTQAIEKIVEQHKQEKRPWMIGIGYRMYSGRGHYHNDDKNIFHVLMEGELTPNKKKIADLVAPELAEKSYRIHAAVESWKGSYGQDIYQYWETYRNALHSAVASGRLENVEYALSKGAKQSTLYNGYGSTAFADAVARNAEPNYHAIAVRLFEDALKMKKGEGAKVLRESTRWGRNHSSRRPIEMLARQGDLEFTVAMAQANAGTPELTAQAFTYSSPITLGNYHSVATGGEVIFHPPVHTTRTKTEYVVSETGNIESPFPQIRQAVFNLDPNRGYAAYQDIFGLAMTHLIEKGALKKTDLPEEKLSNKRALSFVFSMRAAAEAEKARNPGFLADTAVFTDSFVDEVKKAKSLTGNFRVVYDPKDPDGTEARAKAEKAASRKPSAKKPAQKKKPSNAKKP